MYADTITRSMRKAIMKLRKEKDTDEYNKANNIIPQSIQKMLEILLRLPVAEDSEKYSGKDKVHDKYGMF